MISLIIVSDIRLYREGLMQILGDLETINLLCAVKDFNCAIKEIKLHSPDVVLLDMTMKGSCDAVRDIHSIYPRASIVALAIAEEEESILECAEAGISGYVPREASLDDLIMAVYGAANGELFCSPQIACSLINKISLLAGSVENNSDNKKENTQNTTKDDLTRREKQIVCLMADGNSNKQIARKLTIEVSTVKNHVHNILGKLGVKTRTQAATLIRDQNSWAPSSALDLDPNTKYRTRIQQLSSTLG